MGRKGIIAANTAVLALMVGCGGVQADANIPQAGSPAPEFILPDSDGRPITMTSLTREGPLVIVFHRGHW